MKEILKNHVVYSDTIAWFNNAKQFQKRLKQFIKAAKYHKYFNLRFKINGDVFQIIGDCYKEDWDKETKRWEKL